MIKFFRKIRQNLLSEGKTGKYFKYAIGEIVLVVIGILIALSINNWNESRKEENLKENYYQQLLSDFEIDNNFAKEKISYLQAEIKKIEDYNKIYAKPNLSITEIFDSILKNNFSTSGLEYKTSTIETLINTGDIKIFNPKLRGLLTQYNKSKLENIKSFSANLGDLSDLLKEAALKGASVLIQKKYHNQSQLRQMLTIEKRYPDMYIALDAYLDWKSIVYGAYINNLNQNIDESKEIIEILKTELKK
ncbi:DUF6090 family protein [Algibacter sp.]|uniref:DUF6090 family protein n=1 Tax=Algibacter sp. TaxID=1872428 RepID=UPI003C74E9BC